MFYKFRDRTIDMVSPEYIILFLLGRLKKLNSEYQKLNHENLPPQSSEYKFNDIRKSQPVYQIQIVESELRKYKILLSNENIIFIKLKNYSLTSTSLGSGGISISNFLVFICVTHLARSILRSPNVI